MKHVETLVGLLLLTVGCAGSTLGAAAGGRERWLEIVTPNFVTRTDLNEPVALDIARGLEEMRAALLLLAWTGAKEPPRGRMDVVVFRSPGDFNRYVALDRQVAGVAMSRPGERKRLAFHPGSQNGIPSVVVHELTHALSAWFMPVQPSWFAEGFAEYMENTTYDRSTGVATMGGTSKHHKEWLELSHLISGSEDLFAAHEPPHDGPYSTTYFYSSAWLFVHYLLNQQGEQFGEFQRRLARLQDWRSAWNAAFPDLSHEQLDQRVVAYAEQMRFATVTGKLQLPPYEPQLRVLSEAEVHGTLAQVSNSELAQKEASEALRLDPNELNALRVQFASLDEGAHAERLALAQRAVAAHPRRAEAWWLLAQAQQEGEGEGPGKADEAALEQARQLDPEHPGVALGIASNLLEQGNGKAALPLTRLALRISGPFGNALGLHLEALVATRDCQRALLVQGSVESFIRYSRAETPIPGCGESSRENMQRLMEPCMKALRAKNAAAADAWSLPGSSPAQKRR